MEYKITTIGNLCKQVCSGGTPTSSNASYYNGDIPWLNTNEVNFCNIYGTNKTISEEGLRHSAAKYIPTNTVVVAMYGVTAGKCAITKIPLTTNQACCNLIIDETEADYRYVYYYLMMQSSHLNSLANGGAQQNLNSILIKKYKISLPSLPLQRRIASILSSYDNLIEANSRRIKILEQMAENLYKEWFVRFRFPNYQNTPIENGIPKGWKKGQLGDICEFLNGFAFKSESFVDEAQYKIVTIKNVQDGKFDGNNVDYINEIPKRMPDYCKLSTGDILLSLTGNVGRVCVVTGDDYLLNQRVAKLNSQYPHFTYCLFRTETIFNTLNAIAYGTAQLNLSPIKAALLKVLVPPTSLRKHFDKQVAPIFSQINTLQLQSANLTRQRDLLLPRLMSGQLTPLTNQ